MTNLLTTMREILNPFCAPAGIVEGVHWEIVLNDGRHVEFVYIINQHTGERWAEYTELDNLERGVTIFKNKEQFLNHPTVKELAEKQENKMSISVEDIQKFFNVANYMGASLHDLTEEDLEMIVAEMHFQDESREKIDNFLNHSDRILNRIREERQKIKDRYAAIFDLQHEFGNMLKEIEENNYSETDYWQSVKPKVDAAYNEAMGKIVSEPVKGPEPREGDSPLYRAICEKFGTPLVKFNEGQLIYKWYRNYKGALQIVACTAATEGIYKMSFDNDVRGTSDMYTYTYVLGCEVHSENDLVEIFFENFGE